MDDDSKTLFALASDEDHARIVGLVDQFDGSGRQFEVVWLRRLPADAVAASINNLMGSQGEKEESSRRRSPWDYDFYGGRGDDSKKKGVKGFGVDADIENNRLLLWANEAELKRVRELLVKLGEIPGGHQNAKPIRFIEPGDAKDTAAMLEKLRAAWPTTGANELIIKAPPPKKAEPAEKAEDEKTPEAPAVTEAAGRSGNRVGDPWADQRGYAQLDAAAAVPAASEAAENSEQEPKAAKAESAPITVTVTEDGRVMLSSSDTAALDRMEDLIGEISPPERRFKVFQCKYIRASEMWYDLSDFFEDELKGNSDGGFTRDWYGFMVPNKKEESAGTGLSKRRKLMITYDRPSNSILVANASPTQLAEIEQLIEQFDKPAASDSVEIRQTAAIKIMYSRPSVIAAAVKEVYRDLLSSRDKEFEGGDKREQRANAERVTVINYGGGGSDSGGDRPSPIKVGFDGALSMGADDISGVLIVSAQKGIFDDIVRMVRELDEQASPKTTVQVHRVMGNVSAEAIQKAVDKAVGTAWLGNRPEQQPNQTGTAGEKKGGDDKRGRGRGESKGDGGNNGNSGE